MNRLRCELTLSLNVLGSNFRGVECLWDELSVGWNICGVRCSETPATHQINSKNFGICEKIRFRTLLIPLSRKRRMDAIFGPTPKLVDCVPDEQNQFGEKKT